jgi:asparagine N-glycosylation enzyme membrane subunit Stt3
VAVAWLWLFARTFHVSVDPVNCAALFLTAWLIYLADRLADSSSLRDGGPRSLRHEFCLNHRQIWIGALAVIAATDAVLIWDHLGPATLLTGAVVGTLALLHLVLNYSLGGSWPPLPLKEVAVGSLFAGGTLVALFPVQPITGSLVISSIAFACLCTLNCISIAFWERELDETQGKVSFATRYPDFHEHLGKFAIAFALTSGLAAIIWREAAPVLGCVGASSLLLALLDFFREKIGRDQRTALADLVLLTPLLALLIRNV